MSLVDTAKAIQQQHIIEYYEQQLEEVLGIFWMLTDNPYRNGTSMTDEEINRMKKFLRDFRYQQGGSYV